MPGPGSKRRSIAHASVAASKPRFYAFNKVSKQPFENAQGLDSRQAALEAVDEKDRDNAEILEVPAGVLVVRDEKGPVGDNGVFTIGK